eukprot:TRINITY_DN22861_c0_g1_i1.p1 TRINITY_DN22861_c0_g1~~TRINITY_DN22861_c0_g1_i1.p1  ORF type:complete len:506 (+),score=41.77 TRINITY_DN22861_c0_g1_i1:104-1621(+)
MANDTPRSRPRSGRAERAPSNRPGHSRAASARKQQHASITAVTRPRTARESTAARPNRFHNESRSFSELGERLEACAKGYTAGDKQATRSFFHGNGKRKPHHDPSHDGFAGRATFAAQKQGLQMSEWPHLSSYKPTSYTGGDHSKLFGRSPSPEERRLTRREPAWDTPYSHDLAGRVKHMTSMSLGGPDELKQSNELVPQDQPYKLGDHVAAAGYSDILRGTRGKQLEQSRVRSFSPRVARSTSPRSRSPEQSRVPAGMASTAHYPTVDFLELRPLKNLFACPATGRYRSPFVTSTSVVPDFMESPRTSNKAKYESMETSATAASDSRRDTRNGVAFAGRPFRLEKGMQIGVKHDNGRVCETWKVSDDAPAFMSQAYDAHRDHIDNHLESRGAKETLSPRERENRDRATQRHAGVWLGRRMHVQCPLTSTAKLGDKYSTSQHVPDFMKTKNLPLVQESGFSGQRGLRCPQGHDKEKWCQAHQEDQFNRLGREGSQRKIHRARSLH